MLQSRPPLLWIGAAFVGAGFGLIGIGSTLAFAAVTVVIWTVGEMIESPLMATFVASRAGSSRQGRFLGVYVLTYFTAGVAGPILGTTIYQRLGPATLYKLRHPRPPDLPGLPNPELPPPTPPTIPRSGLVHRLLSCFPSRRSLASRGRETPFGHPHHQELWQQGHQRA